MRRLTQMKAVHNISYGLYVLTANTEKQNGCIINTLIQVTSVPNQISITVNKDNHEKELCLINIDKINTRLAIIINSMIKWLKDYNKHHESRK